MSAIVSPRYNDLVQIQRALPLIVTPEAVVELRIPDISKGIISGYLDDLDKLVQKASNLSAKAEGIYVFPAVLQCCEMHGGCILFGKQLAVESRKRGIVRHDLIRHSISLLTPIVLWSISKAVSLALEVEARHLMS